ncbi:tRNA 2-selenouridine(34) synthase MnmH [Brachyspira pilosicoli]|uniref:tRNA 2-selenouridine(34) synthase MnmH n=1 Tax=Brachyspira pilosicoli TaxID=52584 RepID=UPI001CA4E7A6|nr:tRNA 2-selenouridine(34) synthase MnmH [Brachyspira pilosicoli]MBW5397347.1 tRNA 2-selenouridine(34) synthase MnmH [Brachyspira pilosicoli]
MVKRIDIEEFLRLQREENLPVIDVRSPSEFNHGHIPNAKNVYLFDDEERKTVGTIYKEEGREAAILKGLEYVGSRMVTILKEVDKISNNNVILMHCFRGGMRSESVAWLCSNYKYDVYVLDGGYKNYRRYVLESFNNKKYKINLVTGRTGSKKTLILNKLKELEYNVVDLEGIAKHKGSAFGWINEGEQPSQEQFENNLCLELSKYDNGASLWVEDESLLIGKRAIPRGLFDNMKSPENIIYLNVSIEERAKYITDTYGKYSIDDLRESIIKIKKRLGDERMREALSLLEEGKIYECVLVLLYYYDKAYRLSIQEENKIINIECNNLTIDDIVSAISKLKS